MVSGGRNFVFLRPAYDGGENGNGGPGSREKEIGFYPSFQKRDAHALRFGSMNPISSFLGPGSKVGRCKGSNPALNLGKNYNLGGSLLFLYCCFIAGMKFRRTEWWLKRAKQGD